jgi:hypothetical protein
MAYERLPPLTRSLIIDQETCVQYRAAYGLSQWHKVRYYLFRCVHSAQKVWSTPRWRQGGRQAKHKLRPLLHMSRSVYIVHEPVPTRRPGPGTALTGHPVAQDYSGRAAVRNSIDTPTYEYSPSLPRDGRRWPARCVGHQAGKSQILLPCSKLFLREVKVRIEPIRTS